MQTDTSIDRFDREMVPFRGSGLICHDVLDIGILARKKEDKERPSTSCVPQSMCTTVSHLVSISNIKPVSPEQKRPSSIRSQIPRSTSSLFCLQTRSVRNACVSSAGL
jgi:hypothetical protein